MFVYDFLIQDAYLMIYFFISKLTQCLFRRNNTIFIVFHCIDDIVVSYTTLDYVILLLFHAASTAIHYIIQPFKIIAFENLHPIFF